MKPAPIPDNEPERLKSLKAMNVLSSPADAALDSVTRLAQRISGVSIALISLVDMNRQWFLSRVGLQASETPRDISFCGHAICHRDLFVIPDALEDLRFADNPLVTGPPFIRFYAGMPLRNTDGYFVGTLCIIDPQPQKMNWNTLSTLKDLARLAEVVVEHRRLGETQRKVMEELDEAHREALLCPLTQTWNQRGLDTLYYRTAVVAAREDRPLGFVVLGIDHAERIRAAHGAEVVDKVTCMLASILRSNSRSYDILARLEDNAFAVLMPGVKPEDLERTGDKLLSGVRAEGAIPVPADGPTPHRFTCSAGLVTIEPQAARLGRDEALRRATDALLWAQKEGGDRGRLSQAVGPEVAA